MGRCFLKTSDHDIQQDEGHESNNLQSAHDEEIKDEMINNEDDNNVTDSWADEDGIPYIIDFMPSSPQNRAEKICDSLSSEINDDYFMDSNDDLVDIFIDEYGIEYSLDKKVLKKVPNDMKEYSIIDGTEIIVDAAFSNCEDLVSVSIPDSVKKIGHYAFAGCKSLSIVRIPHGTRAKFEKLLPEWKSILVEKLEDVADTLSDFELSDGSIYNGGCLRNPFGSVVLNGIGSLTYPNGDKYKGNFKNGRPYGWGIYWFQNGHKYKGYFDERPKGIGYLNEDYDMAIGNFFEGRLQGWAICYRNRIFKYGYWENGKLIKDESENTLWIRKQISQERACYHGNLIQIDNEHEYIRFGIPPKIVGEKIPGIPESQLPKMPAWGFEFFKDGSVKVGAIRNHYSGEFTIYYPDGTLELGKWNDGIKTTSYTIDRLQKNVDEYEVDGLDVF